MKKYRWLFKSAAILTLIATFGSVSIKSALAEETETTAGEKQRALARSSATFEIEGITSGFLGTEISQDLLKEGISNVTFPWGAPAQIEEYSIFPAFPAGYTLSYEGKDYFSKTTANHTYSLEIKDTSTLLPLGSDTREFAVSATDTQKPILGLNRNPATGEVFTNEATLNGQGILFDGSTRIDQKYGYTLEVGSTTPINDVIKEIWKGADDNLIVAKVKTDELPFDEMSTAETEGQYAFYAFGGEELKQDPDFTGLQSEILGGYLSDTGNAAFRIIDTGNSNLQTPGVYYYQVEIENKAGVAQTFALPLIVVNSLEPYSDYFHANHSREDTLAYNSSFDPYAGITFYGNDAKMNVITNTPERKGQIELTGAEQVDTSQPGATYPLTYKVTNGMGKTKEFTRTVTIKAKPSTGGGSGNSSNGETEKPSVGEGEKPGKPDTGATLKKTYRLFNPNNGSHLITTNLAEYHMLVARGWTAEDTTYHFVAKGNPIYRLYNPNTGEHFYTADSTEYRQVIASGWRNESVAYYGVNKGDKGSVPIYRLFNPNATNAGSHHFTENIHEYSMLITAGWIGEGIAFYGVV